MSLFSRLFRRKKLQFRSELSGLDFKILRDEFDLVVPDALVDLYNNGDPEEVKGDVFYRFRQVEDGEELKYLIKFLPITIENQESVAALEKRFSRKYVIFGIDDFFNLFLMERRMDSRDVFFADMELFDEMPFLVCSLPELVMNLDEG